MKRKRSDDYEDRSTIVRGDSIKKDLPTTSEIHTSIEAKAILDSQAPVIDVVMRT